MKEPSLKKKIEYRALEPMLHSLRRRVKGEDLFSSQFLFHIASECMQAEVFESPSVKQPKLRTVPLKYVEQSRKAVAHQTVFTTVLDVIQH